MATPPRAFSAFKTDQNNGLTMATFYPTLPDTTRLRPKRAWTLGNYGCALFENVRSLDSSYLYPYVIEVRGPFPSSDPDLPLIMTLESGGGTFHLCAFAKNGRIDFGNSPDWDNEDKFLAKALMLIRKNLNISEDPMLPT